MKNSARARLARPASLIEHTPQVVRVPLGCIHPVAIPTRTMAGSQAPGPPEQRRHLPARINAAAGLTGRRGPQGRGSPLTAPEVAEPLRDSPTLR
jgi:hypothetical protein